MCSCATMTPEQKATLIAGFIADAKDIADVGTTAALIEKPELRADLEKVRDSIAVLANLPEGQVKVDDLLTALTKLPLDQLTSEKGQIYALGGRILIRRFVSWAADPEVDVGASGAVKKFAFAISEGMTDALKRRP